MVELLGDITGCGVSRNVCIPAGYQILMSRKSHAFRSIELITVVPGGRKTCADPAHAAGLDFAERDSVLLTQTIRSEVGPIGSPSYPRTAIRVPGTRAISRLSYSRNNNVAISGIGATRILAGHRLPCRLIRVPGGKDTHDCTRKDRVEWFAGCCILIDFRPSCRRRDQLIDEFQCPSRCFNFFNRV